MHSEVISCVHHEKISYAEIKCELIIDKKSAQRSIMNYLLNHKDVTYLAYGKESPYTSDLAVKFGSYNRKLVLQIVADKDTPSNLKIDLIATTLVSETLDDELWQKMADEFCSMLQDWEYDDVSEEIFTIESEKLSTY